MMRVLAIVGVVMVVSVGAAQAQAGPSFPPIVPRLMLRTIMTSADVTDAQKAQIKAVMEQQRPAIKAAVTAHELTALRAALRPVMEEVLTVLTPEQRQIIRAAVQEQLKSFSGRIPPQ